MCVYNTENSNIYLVEAKCFCSKNVTRHNSIPFSTFTTKKRHVCTTWESSAKDRKHHKKNGPTEIRTLVV